MPKLNWDGNDFRNSQDSSGTVADNISRNGNLQQGYSHGSLTRGLVAYYPMEKGAGRVLQDGAMDNLGQIEGATWDANTAFGDYSLYFDGSNSVDIDGERILDSDTEALTASAWIYVDSSISSRTNFFVIEEASGGGVMSFKMDVESDSSLRFQDKDGGYTAGSVPDNQWANIVIVADQENVKGFIDGEEFVLKSSAWNQGVPNTSAVEISDEGHSKYIEELRIFQRALSEPEIKALANLSQLSGVKRTESSVPGVNDGGVSHWKLDNANNDSGVAKDSWSDNQGSITGASYSSDSVFGTSLRFDGGSDYVATNYNGPAEGGSFSIGSWVKCDDLGVNRHYLGPYDHGTNRGFWLEAYSGSNGNWRFGVGYDSDFTTIDASKPLRTGDWYHVYGTYDGSEMKLYVNGRLEAKASTSYVQGPDLRMGHIDPDNFNPLIGDLEDVRTYNRALTPLEVEKLYHKGAYRISREGTLQ